MIKTRVAAVQFSYDDRVTASPVRPVVLRNGAGIEDPLRVVLGFLKAPGRFDVSDPLRPAWRSRRTAACIRAHRSAAALRSM